MSLIIHLPVLTLRVLDFNTQTKFDSVYNRAKANGVKVFLSINGAHASFAKPVHHLPQG